MDNSFQLSPSEHERIYQKIIEPTNFDDTATAEKPRMIIVGAQTGAGKSRLVELSVREFGDATPVIVNTDELRAYHPKFEEIVMMDDTRSAGRTHHDASAWKNKLLSRCIETKSKCGLGGCFQR